MPFYLLYSSKCTMSVSMGRLSKLADSAAKNNAKYNVTGILLFDARCFLQVLEGDDLTELFQIFDSRICIDQMHSRIKIHAIGETQPRNFSRWNMRSCFSPHANIGYLHEQLPEVTARIVNTHDPKFITIAICLIKQAMDMHGLTLTTPQSSFISKLTERETDVMEKLLRGYSPSSIGNLLSISVKTVGRHIENISHKLGCKNRQELIQKVYDRGEFETV